MTCEEDLAAATAANATLTTQVNNLTTQNEDLTDTVTDLTDTVNDLHVTVNDLNERLLGDQGRKADLFLANQTIVNLRKELVAAFSEIRRLQKEIEDLTGVVGPSSAEPIPTPQPGPPLPELSQETSRPIEESWLPMQRPYEP